MLGAIANTERLAIYVLDSGKMRTAGVHWRAFLPGGDGERSFFRTNGLTDVEVAGIGQREVGDPEGRQIRGWAELLAQHVMPPLVLMPFEPPERHGAIVNWPTEIQERNSFAQQLAGKSLKRVWPPIGPVP
jgi:hypothetical protein